MCVKKKRKKYLSKKSRYQYYQLFFENVSFPATSRKNAHDQQIRSIILQNSAVPSAHVQRVFFFFSSLIRRMYALYQAAIIWVLPVFSPIEALSKCSKEKKMKVKHRTLHRKWPEFSCNLLSHFSKKSSFTNGAWKMQSHFGYRSTHTWLSILYLFKYDL